MIIVFDIGATRMRLATWSSVGLGDVQRHDTEPSREGLLRAIDLIGVAAESNKATAVTGGVPGELEGEEGKLGFSPNLPQWSGLPIRRLFAQRLQVPQQIANDTVLCGLGEAHNGAGETKGVMVYVTVSTGVNAVRIVDGRVDPTIKRFELGNMIIDADDRPPAALESLAGGAAMQEREGRPPREVRSRRVWLEEDQALAVGLYDLMLHWTPDVVVLGGSMMRDIDLSRVRNNILRLPHAKEMLVPLRRAKLHDLAGLYGAATWHEQH